MLKFSLKLVTPYNVEFRKLQTVTARGTQKLLYTPSTVHPAHNIHKPHFIYFIIISSSSNKCNTGCYASLTALIVLA